MTFLAPSSLGSFSTAYPLSPAILRHELAHHPLLSLAALAEAARELPVQHVERRVADAVNGGDFAMDAPDGGDVADVIPSIETSGNWIMLRFVEQLPRYRHLLEGLMAELDPAIAPLTGASRSLKGFIFISAPGTLTPFHFDAEYNILLQIAGDKDFVTYPPEPPFLSQGRREAYHRAGENMLPWQDDFEALGTVHPLAPGDALYVPHASPHWVRAGAAPSISLSMTWQNDWSLAAGDALTVNPVLRRFGLRADIPVWPKKPVWRALGCRAARRVRLL
ncbi:cupin-like domain-containing protein [Sphingopyxis sp. R3-92]|uniref:cupin-like domain-containing protein n=1 Tax=Sphingopyxis sp. R3-92 TaxID=3158553 RepID=UPI003EE592ED